MSWFRSRDPRVMSPDVIQLSALNFFIIDGVCVVTGALPLCQHARLLRKSTGKGTYMCNWRRNLPKHVS